MKINFHVFYVFECAVCETDIYNCGSDLDSECKQKLVFSKKFSIFEYDQRKIGTKFITFKIWSLNNLIPEFSL